MGSLFRLLSDLLVSWRSAAEMMILEDYLLHAVNMVVSC